MVKTFPAMVKKCFLIVNLDLPCGLIEGKRPKVLIGVWIQGLVLSTVVISTHIEHPDVITRLGKTVG